jgi:ketosteroid isomerase-like protein
MVLDRVRAGLLSAVMMCAAAGPAAAAGPPALAPIATFYRAANAGDRAALVAAFTPDSAILDEFAPFAFPAPRAAAHWYDGFGADQSANGVTNARIIYTPPTFITVTGTHAYVVVPTVYTYKIHGKPARESGSLAFALRARGGVWKISSMAWAKLTDTSQ